MIKKYALIALAGLFSLFSVLTHAAEYQEGKQYVTLKKQVAQAPAVVEFFSFYCPPCNMFANTYHIGAAINDVLPKGEKVVKYHVGSMGPMGNELTQAWSIAIALGVENKIEKPLFDAVQKDRSIHNAQDIREVFIRAGIPAQDYDNAMQSFMVKSITAKQQQAVESFGVRGTPSIYVDGKFLVKNDGIATQSVDGYRNEFASIVKSLLNAQQGK